MLCLDMGAKNTWLKSGEDVFFHKIPVLVCTNMAENSSEVLLKKKKKNCPLHLLTLKSAHKQVVRT